VKQFRFHLHALFRLREANRDARRAELAQAIAEQERLIAEQTAIQQQLAKHRQIDRELRASTQFSPESLRQAEGIRQAMAKTHLRQKSAIMAAAGQVEVFRRQLADAEREYQVIVRVRDLRFAAHQISTSREEAKVMDESAARTLRRTGPAGCASNSSHRNVDS
jgi:flagellar export protein FliJ